MTGSGLARTLALCGCFVVAAVVLDRQPVRPGRAADAARLVCDGSRGWKSTRSVEFDPKIVTILGVTEYLNRVYVREQDRAQAGLYVGYYKSQRQGESIHSPLNCLPGSGWQPITSGRAIIPIPPDASPSPAAPSIEVNRYVVQKGLDTLLVMYWYQSHGRVIASEYWGKFYLVADALRLNRTDAAMIRVMVPITSPAATEAADRTATNFVQAMVRPSSGGVRMRAGSTARALASSRGFSRSSARGAGRVDDGGLRSADSYVAAGPDTPPRGGIGSIVMPPRAQRDPRFAKAPPSADAYAPTISRAPRRNTSSPRSCCLTMPRRS